MKIVYARLTGISASFRIAYTVSGNQLSLTVPPYSTILGMLTFAKNEEITPNQTRIGMRYTYKGMARDLEKFHRWKRKSSGRYGYNKTNIRKRDIHIFPELELVLTNVEFKDIVDLPRRPLFLGRSQDLVAVEDLRIIDAVPVKKGRLHGTLLPIELGQPLPANGMIYNLPEHFDYQEGRVRRPQNIRTFLALPQEEQEIEFPDLFCLPDLDHRVFYIHRWK